MKLAPPSWSALKVIGNSYPAKLAIIMPFLGYMIIFQHDFVQFVSKLSPIGDISNMQSHTTSINYNIYFLYFGTFVFGLGSFVFSIFCNSHIKQHADSDAFCVYVSPTTTSDDIKRYCDRIIHTLGEKSHDGQRAKVISQSISSGIQKDIQTESRLFVYKTYYNIIDNNYVIPRAIAFLSFIIGLATLAAPSVSVFVNVCRIFFEGLF